MPHRQIIPLYEALTQRATAAALRDLKSDDTAERLLALIVASHAYAATLERRLLVSKVPDKSYFMLANETGTKTSRSINSNLYLNDLTAEDIHSALSCEPGDLTAARLTRIVYTCAIAFCASIDILKVGDQKTPGSFFEFLIGHIVAKALNVNPEKQIRVPTLDLNVTIPTDFVFDLGPTKNRVHLPIKLSTRERVVQVWAHQRVLDGMHGVARFKGVLVAMAETNKQQNTNVLEVCLPNQWTAYQMYIAQMFRVYYLDLPQQYVSLKDRYPFIQVRPFGEFYREVDKIERSGVGA